MENCLGEIKASFYSKESWHDCKALSWTYRLNYVAKCNLGKVKLQANTVSGLLPKGMWYEGCLQGPFAYLVTYVASHAGIFELIFADLWLSESLQILAPSPSLPFCALVSIRLCEYFPPNSFSVTVPVGSCMQGWFPLAGLLWIPPCYAWGIQAPVQPLRHQFPSSSIGDEFNYWFFTFFAITGDQTDPKNCPNLLLAFQTLTSIFLSNPDSSSSIRDWPRQSCIICIHKFSINIIWQSSINNSNSYQMPLIWLQFFTLTLQKVVRCDRCISSGRPVEKHKVVVLNDQLIYIGKIWRCVFIFRNYCPAVTKRKDEKIQSGLIYIKIPQEVRRGRSGGVVTS